MASIARVMRFSCFAMLSNSTLDYQQKQVRGYLNYRGSRVGRPTYFDLWLQAGLLNISLTFIVLVNYAMYLIKGQGCPVQNEKFLGILRQFD